MIILQSFSRTVGWRLQLVARRFRAICFAPDSLRPTSHEVFYVFGWLLPLGAVRLGCLPRPWVVASGLTALVALVLGASVDAHGNVARAIFDVAGPMLSLSVAMLIARISEPRVKPAV